LSGRGRLFLLAGLLLAACAPIPAPPPAAPPAPPKAVFTPIAFAELPGWGSDNGLGDALAALRRSCQVLTKRSDELRQGSSALPNGAKAGDWKAVCRALPANDDVPAARAFFETRFQPHRVADGEQEKGLFTGYYEAELKGSRTKLRPGQVPLLGPPTDLVEVDLGQFREEWRDIRISGRIEGGRLRPYSTRAEIEAGKLGDKAPVLAWADDAVDAHILHIQGSGRLVLDDGSAIRLGYAASNGHRFVGLGKILAERGKASGSMQDIRAWLKTNRAEAPALMAENPRYIFLRIIEGEGPIGAQGVALTPGRSLAVDPRFIPYGAPLWLDTVEPGGKALRRLMIAQDTGAAITGVVRGDVFWGTGEAALAQAGRMKSPGGYFILLPK